MKRFLVVALLLSIIFSGLCFAGVEQKALVTSFSKDGGVVIGFSRTDVLNANPVADADRFANNEEIVLDFDIANSVYYTDVFYAYCQSFSADPTTVTVTIPKYFKDSSVRLIVVDPSGVRPDDKRFGPWTDKENAYVYTVAETKKFGKPRVVMCQPINIRVESSPNIVPLVKYTLEIELKIGGE